MHLKILKQPYPFNNNLKKEFLSSFLFGTFVFLFLAFFQPFGLSQYQSSTKTIELAGYGLVTFLCLFSNTVFFSLAFKNWFSEESWTVGKNISYTIYMFFCIGLGNLFYSVYRGFIAFEFNSFIIYQGLTLAVGIIPVTISTLLIYSSRLKKSVKEAEQLNKTIHHSPLNQVNVLEIPSLNKSESLSININDLLAIKAVENYVEIYFIRNHSTQKEVLRNTLKNLLLFFSDKKNIIQCHRSYLVNVDSIYKVNGNAQGLKLMCGEDQSLEVAVSRSYVQTIKKELKKNETIQ